MSNMSLFELLLSNKRPKLTCSKFKELYTIDSSCQGSNNRSREEDAVYCFELFLADLEDGQVEQLSLEELLIFITGADAVPHLGFERSITIQFYDNDEGTKLMPWSSTCGLTLNLPRQCCDPDKFREMMTQALCCCHGFGLV